MEKSCRYRPYMCSFPLSCMMGTAFVGLNYKIIQNARYIHQNTLNIFYYMHRVLFIFCNSINESKIITNIYKLLCFYMFRHKMCHPQEAFKVFINFRKSRNCTYIIYQCNKPSSLTMTHSVSKHVGAK